MYKNLREFLSRLDRAGELKHIQCRVSSHLEISKLIELESKSPDGGAALLFEHVDGSAFPVTANIFGSPKRICMALGVSCLDELADRARSYITLQPPKNFKGFLNLLPMVIGATRFFPRTFKGKTPPCQEVVLTGGQIDVYKLPVPQCWPKDGGPFITLPLVFTRSLETGRQNLGMYRMQVFDKTTTGMHWHIHKDGSHYHGEYRRAKKRMPVSVAIGADPATIYAATAPMPRGIDELLLSGFIRRKPVVMTRCVTNDIKVPAEAEFVLEGYVDPDELRWEGPFGDHTGYYSLADHYPVFHVTAITHRKNPIYVTTLVGRPPMEDCYLAQATERLCLPLLQTVMPEVKDYWLPWEGVFHNSVVVSLDKEYAGHAHKLVSGLWGQGQMSFCKTITVVDREVTPSDRSTLIDLLLTRLDLSSDIIQTRGILDVLDHSSPVANFGAKIGIDLTTRVPGEPDRRQVLLPQPPKAPIDVSAIRRLVPEIRTCRHLFSEYPVTDRTVNRILALTITKTEDQSGRDISDKIAALEALHPFNILILFDEAIDLSNGGLMLWKIFNNVDPGRDMVFYGRRLILNACKKGPADGHTRPWPEDLSFSE